MRPKMFYLGKIVYTLSFSVVRVLSLPLNMTYLHMIVDIPTPTTLDSAAFRRITSTTVEITIPIIQSEFVR